MLNDSPFYDYVIIGSNPIFLLEAIIRAKAGQKVLVIERNQLLGGAWSYIQIFERYMDNGPHILYNFNSDVNYIFEFIQEQIGQKFLFFDPQPEREGNFFYYNSPEVSFFPVPIPVVQKMLLSPFVGGRFLLRKVKEKFRQYDILKYKFPSKGTFSLINKLADTLILNGGVIKCLEEVEEICENTKEVTISTNKLTYKSKAVLCSSRIKLDKIKISNQNFLLPFKSVELTQAYIRIRDKSQERFSYYKFVRHPYFFLAADISQTVSPPLTNNEKIITFSFNFGQNGKDLSPDYCISELQNRKKIGSNIEIIDFHIKSFPLIQREVREINNFHSNRIELFHCDNLMRGMIQRFKYWT